MTNITIIVPVYNTEKFISKCIDSLISQTINDIEIILVNDGSSDNSGHICDEYAMLDERIIVIHKNNGGTSDARNEGLKHATGEYIGFVDSDDYIECDMYEKLYNACIYYNSNISMCGRYDVIDKKRIPFFSFDGFKLWSSSEAIERFLLWDNIDSSMCDKLFHNSLFKDIRFPVGKSNEDIYIMPELLHKSGTIIHIGEAKYNYYHRENSRSTGCFTKRKMDLLEATSEIIDFINQNYKELQPKAISFHQVGIINLLRLFKNKKTKRKFFDSYRYLKKLLSENIKSILRSKYIHRNHKIIALLIKTNTYNTLIFFRNIIKSIKRLAYIKGEE